MRGGPHGAVDNNEKRQSLFCETAAWFDRRSREPTCQAERHAQRNETARKRLREHAQTELGAHHYKLRVDMAKANRARGSEKARLRLGHLVIAAGQSIERRCRSSSAE